tara:strand:+ start:842 stop:2080 length:1239 start_codon:yes stop_codon:yes gene_type:complete
MNVVEMHLAIRQGVDKINSLQADMLLSQEIDIEVNKSMSKFVNTKYGRNNLHGKGFEESQKRIDDLRTLVTEYENSVTYKGRHNNDFFIDQFKLPSDYLYLVNQKSTILSNDCETIEFSLDNNSPLSYFIFPLEYLYLDLETGNPIIETPGFTDSNNTIGGFLYNLRMVADLDNITQGDQEILDLGTSAIAPFDYPTDLETLRLTMLHPSNWASGIEIFWEEHGQINAPGSFIVTVDTNIYDWFNWDMATTNSVSTTNEVTQLVGFHNPISGSSASTVDQWPKVNAQYTDSFANSKRITSATSRSIAFNKFIQQDDIFKLLEDPFNTTKHTSPLTTIRGSYIDIYTSDIFIIDKVKITYIRKPKEISLTLDTSCELPVHTHREIVDMTISSILEGLNDPRYKTHQLEVSKNE